jgi:trypsin-like peptidase
MEADLVRSVVLITGANPSRFGTGFVIFRDEQATFVLTCRHVVDDVGGSDALLVGNDKASVIASDEANGFDLAVLRIEKLLSSPVMKLHAAGRHEDDFTTRGFHAVGKQIVSQELGGKLRDYVGLQSRSYGMGSAWSLEIDDPGKSPRQLLQPGYSGAPVLDTRQRVIGVVSVSQDGGRQGWAISVAVLKDIWPQMPAGLIVEQAESEVQPRDPVMNLKEELDAFRKVANREDKLTRVILISGEGGMGKTHLMELYRRVARTNQIDYLDLPLGQQVTVEECIDRMIGSLGGFGRFPRYDEYRSATNRPGTRAEEADWHRNLTRKVFMDLPGCGTVKPLVLFFDQHEKADPAFKGWLSEGFLPYVTSPLIVVVAGREALELPSLRGHRDFRLGGVEAHWFHQYCEDCKVVVPREVIDALHVALHGRPKEFVEFLKIKATRNA